MVDSILIEIRVKGHLSTLWNDWFGGLSIENQPGGETTLVGTLVDQAALFGVLSRVRDLGLALVSVRCTEIEPGQAHDVESDQGERCSASS